MCLVVLSSGHPDYPFILISNRDEFLHRETLRADWWKNPDSHILGGRDLQRAEQGTWLGITRDGRIAILTNFREEGHEDKTDERSRGGIASLFLRAPATESLDGFAKRLIDEEGVKGIGGFSLIFGKLHSGIESSKRSMGVVSNRTPDVQGVVWLAGDKGDSYGQTCALSNSNFGDRAWPKVVRGETLLSEAIKVNIADHSSKDALIEDLFAILSVDSLPRKRADEDWSTYSRQLRNSIFIPRLGADNVDDEVASAGKVYATQKQTVVVVDRRGMVTFTERTLYDNDAKPVPKDSQDRRFEFQIEGWGQ